MNTDGVPGRRPAHYWIQLGIDMKGCLAAIDAEMEDAQDTITSALIDEGIPRSEWDELINRFKFAMMCKADPTIAERLAEAEATDRSMGLENDRSYMTGYN